MTHAQALNPGAMAQELTQRYAGTNTEIFDPLGACAVACAVADCTWGLAPLAATQVPPGLTKGRHSSASTRSSATARATARSCFCRMMMMAQQYNTTVL
jgi:hypothetical protein